MSAISEAKEKGRNESTQLQLSNETSQEPEFELYCDIIRKYTWYEGLGEPISQETANHLPYYFKFSMKNPQGHWQHIEAMHADTMTTRHNISTYVLDKRYDMNDNTREWVEKLRTVAQWFITSDLDGKDVVEERAYSSKGDLVYSFMPIKNRDGRITGCYNDAWGLPADMREEEESTYGSVVCITYDKFGRDSIIDYLDGQGLRKHNNNGVDQERFVYDDKDRVVLATSHNMVGDYTIDNWGNCGNRYIYDDTNNKYSVVCVGKDLKPMAMPDTRANTSQMFIRCDIIKDKWGRNVEQVMLDAEGNASETASGVHKIKFNYDNHGNLLSTQYFDISGNFINE